MISTKIIYYTMYYKKNYIIIYINIVYIVYVNKKNPKFIIKQFSISK